jgi:hypothetical protein
MPKFKVVKVALFRHKNKTYVTGEIVELSEVDAKRLTPCDYLQPIAEPEKEGKSEKAKK